MSLSFLPVFLVLQKLLWEISERETELAHLGKIRDLVQLSVGSCEASGAICGVFERSIFFLRVGEKEGVIEMNYGG